MILQENPKNGQFYMTLPKAVIEGIGWQKGDRILVRIAGKDRLELLREPTGKTIHSPESVEI